MGYGSDIEYKENTAKTVSQETVSPEMSERDLSWSEVYDQASENLSDSGLQALKDLIEQEEGGQYKYGTDKKE